MAIVEGKKRTIFAVLNHEAGRGPARLRRLVWDQEIAGSNPAAPTTKAAHTVSGFFVRESERLLSSEQQTKTTGLQSNGLWNPPVQPGSERRTQRAAKSPRPDTKAASNPVHGFFVRESSLLSSERMDHGLPNGTRPIHRSNGKSAMYSHYGQNCRDTV